MRVLWGVLRIFSYIFETVLCAMGFLLCAFSAVSRHVHIHLGWLPFDANRQVAWILGLSIAGLISVILAIRGAWIFLASFSAAVFYILLRGFFLNTQYVFSGHAGFRNALLLTLGSLLAFLGALSFARRSRARK